LAEFAKEDFGMRSYEAARNLFSFLALCSWAVIVLGGIVAFSGGTIAGTGFGRGASGMSALIGAAPGIILAMIGFYGLALVQMGRAGVDNAEYSQQSLEVARQQLEVSRQVLAQGKTTAASYTGAQPQTGKANATAASNAVGYADQVMEPKPTSTPSLSLADGTPPPTLDQNETPALEKTLQEATLADPSPEKQPEPIQIPAGKFSGV
jgi:hypothetical protein